MTATVEDLRSTIIPKSDQLNAEQLLGGPITVTVTDVRLGSGEEQPVIVHYEGEDGRPYKPCKTMRKVLIHAWGADGRAWIGRSMILYNDPAVRFGGEDVGGIRISHLSDIERDVRVSLTSTRGKKAKYEIRRLAQQQSGANISGALDAIAQAPTMADLQAIYTKSYRAAKGSDKDTLTVAKDARKAALASAAPPAFDLVAAIAKIDACSDPDTLAVMIDEISTTLPDGPEKDAAIAAYRARVEAL